MADEPSYENVTVERDGPVATVTFDRGGRLNAFDQTTILELTDVARRFQDDLTTQAVVLSGGGRRLLGRHRPQGRGDLGRARRRGPAGPLVPGRPPVPGLGGHAPDHDRGHGGPVGRCRLRHRPGLRLAGPGRRRLPLRARGQDRAEPPVGCPAPADHPRRAGPGQADRAAVRAHGTRAGPRLGPDRRGGRVRRQTVAVARSWPRSLRRCRPPPPGWSRRRSTPPPTPCTGRRRSPTPTRAH